MFGRGEVTSDAGAEKVAESWERIAVSSLVLRNSDEVRLFDSTARVKVNHIHIECTEITP